ncbi:hypothetical protein MP638_002263 [Amoeboaphelidium occidentale]|nr:hypothetical protein MP638_002263 [Amoeboaphelidium occidentale]
MTNEDNNSKQFKAYACLKNGEPLQKWSYTPRPLGENDVEIKIEHCGICASDIHTLTSGWGPTQYPVVVGHEITGKVVAAGPKVTRCKVGDRVGVGAMVFACREPSCSECSNGRDNLCPKKVFTYNAKYSDGCIAYGGYAEAVRVPADYAFVIPDKLSLEVAAPLLCAGITVFSPLDRYRVGPGMKVGVVGIGGLGHLAIQFASKMGAHVVAVSHSASKKDECTKLGAKTFANISEKQNVQDLSGTLDLLLVTSNHKGQPWGNYLNFLKTEGTLVLLALPEEELKIMPSALIMKQVTMSGSLIGSQAGIEKMLAFAAEHDVKPWIEQCPMKEVNEAIDRVHHGKVRYRVVMKADL